MQISQSETFNRIIDIFPDFYLSRMTRISLRLRTGLMVAGGSSKDGRGYAGKGGLDEAEMRPKSFSEFSGESIKPGDII
jgi:hypothetical protein